jgi:hypothetical protein
MTPSGIEQETFRFVAQYLRHCATTVPNHNPGTNTLRPSVGSFNIIEAANDVLRDGVHKIYQRLLYS